MASILFVGDIHLGRRPAGLHDALGEYGLSSRELGPAAAFGNVVRWAREHEPAAVVLAGDVVESDNARFEAWGTLRGGVAELCEAGIPVVAVAGNHDVDALPRLAELIDDFHLLGAGGRWETWDVRQDGADVARLLGWSFPRKVVDKSPIRELRVAHDHAVPLLGVLHCDLDATDRRYAPVLRSELENTPTAGWFLGHVHAPSLTGSSRPIGYLGTLSALTRKETGPRGPWRVDLEATGRVSCSHLPLAPLRFEWCDVDVTSVADPGRELDRLIAEALERQHRELRSSLGSARAVGSRIRLVGTTGEWIALERAVDALAPESIHVRLDGVVHFLVEVRNRCVPDRDLDGLANGNDLPALLASELLALQRGDEQGTASIAGAQSRLLDVAAARQFRGLPGGPPSIDEVRELLMAAGREALEELLAQREALDETESAS